MTTEQIRNAERLANALKNGTDERDLRRLTQILNYVSDEALQRDINDLWELVVIELNQ